MRHHGGLGTTSEIWTRNYSYASDSNRLLRTWMGRNELEAVEYGYDLHGSMLNLNRSPEEYRLRWDYRDMIHAANLGGGGWAYYNYDASKQRTRKVITNREGVKQWERFYLGGMEVYRRYGVSGVVEEIETHHLFADEQRVLIVEDVLDTDNSNLPRGTLFRYQYGNHLGSVGLEIDGDAAVISYEEYHPYGTTAYRAMNRDVRAVAKRYRYTGMERDEETGLSYHAARFYMPWLGRWCSADPIGLRDGINFYAYGHNNPTTLKDTSGNQSDAGVPRASLPGGAADTDSYGGDTGPRSSSPPPPQRTSGPRLEIYGERIWLENATQTDLERIQAGMQESIAAGILPDGPPAGISAIRLRNGDVYFWEPLSDDNAHIALQYRRSSGMGYLSEQDIAQINGSLQALQTTLEYYAATLEFSVGVATGISAGPRLATALGLAVAREAGEQPTMSFVLAPLINANIDDPATAAILMSVAGMRLGSVLSARPRR